MPKELDFTALFSTPPEPLQRPSEAQEVPLDGLDELLEELFEKPATEPNKGPEKPLEALGLHQLAQEQKERATARKIYAMHQENMERAGTLRSEITKEIQSGENPCSILLKAVECISLMTGDTAVYSQVKADLLTVYGWGLGEPAPLRQELEAVQNRLAMLTRPELKTALEDPDEQKHIERAIKAHRAKIEALEREILRADR